jgi:hypothetical protein
MPDLASDGKLRGARLTVYWTVLDELVEELDEAG